MFYSFIIPGFKVYEVSLKVKEMISTSRLLKFFLLLFCILGWQKISSQEWSGDITSLWDSAELKLSLRDKLMRASHALGKNSLPQFEKMVTRLQAHVINYTVYCENYSLLMQAVEKRNLKAIEILFRYGAWINHGAGLKKSPLSIASEKGLFREMKALFFFGADPNYIAIDFMAEVGDAPLFLAASNISKRPEKNHCLSLLIHQGACVDYGNQYGNTALHVAVRSNNLVGAALLLKCHAREIANKEGRFPLDFALEQPMKDLLQTGIASPEFQSQIEEAFDIGRKAALEIIVGSYRNIGEMLEARRCGFL